MTNERAIELLHRISDSQFDGEYGEARREALEMAVRVLEGDGDTISRQQAIEALKDWYDGMIISSFRGIAKVIDALPPVQQETAKRIVGKSRDGMTLWYQCDMCNEPVDMQDNYCRGCGRRLIDG